MMFGNESADSRAEQVDGLIVVFCGGHHLGGCLVEER